MTEVVDSLGPPWSRLVETLLLASLALAFATTAQRSDDHRRGWLLSGAIAAGLAIALFYDLMGN